MAKEKTNSKRETPWETGVRWRKRKSTFKATYKKGVFYADKQLLIAWLKQPDVSIRLHANGGLNDGTEFITISIEGIR